MTSKRRRAKRPAALKKIDEIRALYQLGRRSLDSSVRISAQAEEVGCTQARLALARRFATRYSEEQVDELCALILKHKAVFGTSHIEILLAIPCPKKDKFQLKCIKRNWSRRQLIAAKTLCFRPKSQGGRFPEVTESNVVVEYEDLANAFCRLFEQTNQSINGDPTTLDSLSARLRGWVETVYPSMQGLRKAARAELKKTQKE